MEAPDLTRHGALGKAGDGVSFIVLRDRVKSPLRAIRRTLKHI